MANPTPDAIAWIRGRSPDWSLSDGQVAAAINAATVPNPAAQGQVPLPWAESDLFALLSQPSMANVEQSPAISAIVADINAGDAAAVKTWANFLAGAGRITAAEAAAIVARVARTQPDPAWTATVPAAVVALGRTLDADDVRQARAPQP